MKSIKSISNLKNKKVLVRVDFNVPVGDDGIVDKKEDWRIRAALPTIEYLLKKKAKVILMSHLGRPEKKLEVGNWKSGYSLKPAANRLGELLDCKVRFVGDCIGNKVEKSVNKIKAGEIIMLENLRFYKEEKNNNEKFAEKLAELADIYINNAFSVSHRKHASVCAITKFLPSYAGLLLEKEVRILSEAMENPKRPAVAIIGGAKVETKLPVVKYLANKFDNILVGGVVANEMSDDDTLAEKPTPSLSREGNNQEGNFQEGNVVKLPNDFVWENNERMDIGPETIKEYLKIISRAKTIIWNGPMGMFEKEKFSEGTKSIVAALTKSKSCVIMGGGETIAAVSEFGDLKKIDYVSTGGGAMLEFLAGRKLAGLEALKL